MKDVINMFEENCRQKEMQLNSANIQLNNTEQEKWIIRDQFCSQVWNFSRDHDFSKVFQYYPYITNSIKPHDCPYNNEIESIQNEYYNNTDMQYNEDIQKLSKEISTLTKELLVITADKNLQETTIKNLSVRVERLKLFSEEIKDCLRLISAAGNLSDNKKLKINDLERKNNNLIVNGKKDNALTFTTAKELLEQFKSCSPVLIKNSNTVSKTMVINSNTINNFIKDEKKEFKNKFTVKIQSNLSLKFEQNRQLKEKEKKC
ncbi:uncharacterized protein LOC122525936 [Polistes fuscatus]|uniref:uncharacterized protein LOC122525936 n=1 Tax=Polistes fuscatus TaxID=30207 RepID=UPI001CA98D53|nr:uncharacterized protein LOC122525936 [Polistes fuscatus]